MSSGGSSFYFPDIFPIPSREELRDILEEGADRTHAPDHLREWQELVRSNNPGKNTIGRYARLFELHHFWWALQERHPAALHRRTEKLQEAFAVFLGTSSDSIHKDLGLIADRLGTKWAANNL